MISKLRKLIGGQLWKIKASSAKKRILESKQSVDLAFEKWHLSLQDPTAFYEQCYRYYCRNLPRNLLEHREYFKSSARGFGEDSFHVMWFLILHHFKPNRFLEIGVYRGQTLSLVALLQREIGIKQSVTGISPFLPAGDSVSKYLADIDYREDTLKNFKAFHLDIPRLIPAFSNDQTALDVIAEGGWDAIYIDGNHDYEIALSDWKACSAAVKVGGIVVLDDSGLTTGFKPPAFATGGHPGPSQLASEIVGDSFEEILQVGHNRVFLRRS